MRVLVIGGGGREHALAWKIAQSEALEKLWIAPGNPGTAEVGENVALEVQDTESLVRFAKSNNVNLVVVGPEDPLVAGISDRFFAEGIACFGPRQLSAEIEGSKSYCKELLIRYRVPTAAYRVFSELNPAISYLESGARYPAVVKASGLAAGKGVVICKDSRHARQVAKAMLEDGIHGDAGRTILIEEFLQGPESSAMCLTDGRCFIPLDPCQDHKTLFDGGRGPNTGGMGAICPNPQVSDRSRDAIERQVLLQTLHGLNHEGRRFQGALFAGLKLTPAGPKVLEFNARLGDPETQVLMPRIQSDLLPILDACARGSLEEMQPLTWDPRPAVCVVLAAEGYPKAPRKGDAISGIEEASQEEDVIVFHAGTAVRDQQLVTAGGRVLTVTALGKDLTSARDRAYAAVEKIRFEGKVFRSDIGAAGLEALEAMR